MNAKIKSTVSFPPVTIQINLLNDFPKCKKNPIFRIVPPGNLNLQKFINMGLRIRVDKKPLYFS